MYSGAPYQRGHGLGRVMKNMIRHATPILKQAGSQALKKGISVLAKGVLGNRPRKTRRKVIKKTKVMKVSPKVLPSTARRRRRTKRPTTTKDIFSYK